MPEPVALIHGIRSRRRWLSFAKSILQPHFACREIRYHHYTSTDLAAAPLSIALEPWVLVVSGLLLAALVTRLESVWTMLIVSASGSVATLIAAHFVAQVRYSRATDSVR